MSLRPYAILFCLSGVTLVTTLVTTSCVIAGRPQWSVNVPKDNVRIWSTPITITMSNVTHDSVLTIIESNVLSQTGERIRLSYGHLPEPFDTEYRDENFSSRCSFTSSNIAPYAVVKIIADTQGHRAFFHKQTAVLAPALHGDGYVSIQLTGHCVDADTGEPVPRFDVDNRLIKVTTDTTGVYSVPLKVGGHTESYHVDDSYWYREPHPEKAEISLLIAAPRYETHTITVKLQPGCMVYTNDISLKKAPPHDGQSVLKR